MRYLNVHFFSSISTADFELDSESTLEFVVDLFESGLYYQLDYSKHLIYYEWKLRRQLLEYLYCLIMQIFRIF